MANQLRSPDVPVVYSLDIGVYHETKAGRPLSKSSAAWARLDHDPGDLRQIRMTSRSGTSVELSSANGATTSTDKDMRAFASQISSDLSAGRRVALGFEAPMWIPICTEGPAAGKPLFAPRCSEETTREWYVQAGAAATLKALVLGAWLLSLLREDHRDAKFTVNVESWMKEPPPILLFESFVTGKYRLPPPRKVPADNWDALLGAAAFWGVEVDAGGVSGARPRVFDPELSERVSTLSIWNLVLTQAGYSAPGAQLGRCSVYGLEP